MTRNICYALSVLASGLACIQAIWGFLGMALLLLAGGFVFFILGVGNDAV